MVSGVLSSAGPPGRIVEWLRSGVLRAVLDGRIFGEYEDVMLRSELKLPGREVAIVLRRLRHHARWIEVGPAELAVGLPDPDDAPFVECARSAAVPLVTGNKRHYPAAVTKGVRVMRPADFVGEKTKEGESLNRRKQR